VATPLAPTLQEQVTSEIWTQAALMAARDSRGAEAAAYFKSQSLPNPVTKDFLDRISLIWKSVITSAIQKQSIFISRTEAYLHEARDQNVDHRRPTSPKQIFDSCLDDLKQADERVKILRALSPPNVLIN
jgi:hypothetical protein